MNKEEKIKSILYNYNLNNSINKADEEFMIEVFSNHPHFEEKSKDGIKKIIIIKDKYKGRCFAILTSKEEIIDISYIKALKGKCLSKEETINKACRTAIFPIIKKFKKENLIYGVTRCPYTNELLNMENTHVDHYEKTFNELFKLWIKDKDINELYKKIKIDHYNYDDKIFLDKDIIADFINFHNQNTHLRLVSAKANLSIIKKIK